MRIGLSLLLGMLLVLGGMLPSFARLLPPADVAMAIPTASVDGAEAAPSHGQDHGHADLSGEARHHHDAPWPDHVHEAVMADGGPDLPQHVPPTRRLPLPEVDPPSGPLSRLERPPRALG